MTAQRATWPEVTQPGGLTADQTRALHNQYWPCAAPRSIHHRYHHTTPPWRCRRRAVHRTYRVRQAR